MFWSQSPSSGDCEVAAERTPPPRGASVRHRDGSTRSNIEDPKRHRSHELQQSAYGSRANRRWAVRDAAAMGALPLVGTARVVVGRLEQEFL